MDQHRCRQKSVPNAARCCFCHPQRGYDTVRNAVRNDGKHVPDLACQKYSLSNKI